MEENETEGDSLRLLVEKELGWKEGEAKGISLRFLRENVRKQNTDLASRITDYVESARIVSQQVHNVRRI